MRPLSQVLRRSKAGLARWLLSLSALGLLGVAITGAAQGKAPAQHLWWVAALLSLLNLLGWLVMPPSAGAAARRQLAELKALTQHLQAEGEAERSRLACDLHDELGALLTSARLDVARIKPRLAVALPDMMDGVLRIQRTLDELMAIKRRVTEALWPSALVNLGLAPSLDILISNLVETTGINVNWERVPVQLSASAQLAVYRLVQEGTTNIVKHADATAVWIKMEAAHGVVTVSIADNGVGFEVGRSPAQACGLIGMRVRIESEGGVMTLQSVPGQGTHIQAQLPEVEAASWSGRKKA